MADQDSKTFTDAELTQALQENAAKLPYALRKHIDISKLKAVNSTHPATAADRKAGIVADVRDGSRTTVEVTDPETFMAHPYQLTGHEVTHMIQNGLPKEEQDAIPADSATDVYNYGGTSGLQSAMGQNRNMKTFPPEQQAEIVQYALGQEEHADKATPEQQKDWAAKKPVYDNFINHVGDWKQEAYDDDQPIKTDNDPRLKVSLPAPDAPTAGTIPAATTPQVTGTVFHASNVYGPGDSAPGDAPTDPFAKFAVSGPTASPAPAAAPAASDPFAKYAVGAPSTPTESASPVSAPSPAPASSDPFAKYATNQPTQQSPQNGQPASDPNAGILKKAWNWANTPLTESLGGMSDSRAGAGGVERGIEKIASGFTSPLSIALTLGTFGTAGFIESAGASVLRDVAGMSAAEIADVAKGADAIAQATKTGGSYAEAIQASGADPAVVKKGLDALYASGLKEGDLLGGNAAERGASLMFRKFALSPAKAQIAAKTMQTAVDAGFTYQAVQQAAQMSPRALDALKEGDYDHFAEYATEALAGAAFGAAGASHAIHSAGELAEPLLENKLRPSDETRKFSNLFDALDGQRQQANEQARLLHENTMKALGYSDPKSPFTGKGTTAEQDLRLNQMFHGITLGFDKDLAAEHYNAIAEAAGRPDRLPVQTPETGQTGTLSSVPIDLPSYEDLLSLRGNAPRNLMAPEIRSDEQFLTNAGIAVPKTKTATRQLVDQVVRERFGKASESVQQLPQKVTIYRSIDAPNGVEGLDKSSLGRFWSDKQEGAKSYWSRGGDSILLKAVADKGQLDPHQTLLARMRAATGNDESEINLRKGEQPTQIFYKVKGEDEWKPFSADATQSPVNGQPNPALPENLPDLIANSDLKNKPADYIDHLLQVYKGVHEGFTDTEMAVAKDLRSKLQTGITDANANGIIKGQVENYMQRRWEKPNPTANKTIADAGMGKFTTNVSMAQKRVFESELEPILKGYQLRNENPVTLTSQWLADTYKAIANRKLLDATLDHSIRASDGRPAVVLLGNGQVLEGSHGENPATMIRPDSVRNIKIADPEIQNLKATGALDRYLDDQTILDLTPKVHPDTIPAFIDRLERIGIKQNPQYDEAGNNILRKQIETLKEIQSGKRPMSDLAQINDAQKPVYVWRPQDYIHLDQPSMRKWNFVSHDPSGDPVLVKSDLAVHPEYADYLKTRLGLDESGLQKWGPTRMLLKGGGEAKKLMLSFSPFHMIQEGLRGAMLGVNPFHLTDRTIAEDPVLQKMVGHRLTLEPDYKGLQDESEGVAGHSKLLDKLPFGIGKSMDWYQDFLFKKYIPSLKAEAAVKMFHEYKDAHPDWTDDRVAEVASAHVNDTFGGINYKAMGRSVATQDWARLLTLAPDWLEAELRSGARLFNGDGGIARNQVAKMALSLWGVARVLNYVTTGNFHNEAPFGLAMKDKDGKEMVYSIRTLPTDLLHAATDPVGFMKGRFSPALRAGQEILSSRDQFGRKLSPGDMAVDLARNFAPIPFQSLGQALSGNGPEVGNSGQVVKALGGTAQVYRTEAQKLAAQIASDHSESGPVDPALLHRHRVIMSFEDKVRDGEMALPDVYKLVVSGDLSQADAKKIADNVKLTRGMPADMAALYTRASRLPPKDFLQVWDAGTPREQTAMAPLMIKNRKAYVKKAMTDETPQERQRDPVLHRFMTMFPQAAPF